MRTVAVGWVAGLALVAFGCAEPDTTAVVYTSLDTESLAWARDGFREAHPGFRVDFIHLGADAALERLRSEAGAASADVWLGAPSWRLAEGAAEGLLAPAHPAWAEGVPDDMRDPAGRWVGLAVDPLVLAFGTEAVARSRAPRDWVDLEHPRWSGEVVVVEPGASDAMTALLVHHMWEAHELHGDANQGLDRFVRLDLWRRGYVGTEEEAARRLRTGDGMVAVLSLSAAEAAREEGGVDYRVPESETPALLQGVALVDGALHEEAARAFLEWVGSPEARAAMTGTAARIPAAGFAVGGRPAWAERAESGLRMRVVPADSVAARVDAWVSLWRGAVRGRAATLF